MLRNTEEKPLCHCVTVLLIKFLGFLFTYINPKQHQQVSQNSKYWKELPVKDRKEAVREKLSYRATMTVGKYISNRSYFHQT